MWSSWSWEDQRRHGASCYLAYLRTPFVVVQLLCHVWLFATPWTPAHQTSLRIRMNTISQSLLKLSIPWVCDAIQPSHPLSSPSPALNLSPGRWHSWQKSSEHNDGTSSNILAKHNPNMDGRQWMSSLEKQEGPFSQAYVKLFREWKKQGRQGWDFRRWFHREP